MELTAQQLKDLLMAVIAEGRKPAPLTEAQEAAFKQELDMRRDMGLQQLQLIANKRAEQAACSHYRRDNSCSGVFISDGYYIICQQCQAKVRPGVAPDKDQSGDIYDTNLFNRLFQSTQSPAMFN